MCTFSRSIIVNGMFKQMLHYIRQNISAKSLIDFIPFHFPCDFLRHQYFMSSFAIRAFFNDDSLHNFNYRKADVIFVPRSL